MIKELGTTLTDTWTVAGSGGGYTVPVEAPRERIDYIWMSKTGGLTAKHGWNPFTEASDHLPVIVDITIP